MLFRSDGTDFAFGLLAFGWYCVANFSSDPSTTPSNGSIEISIAEKIGPGMFNVIPKANGKLLGQISGRVTGGVGIAAGTFDGSWTWTPKGPSVDISTDNLTGSDLTARTPHQAVSVPQGHHHFRNRTLSTLRTNPSPPSTVGDTVGGFLMGSPRSSPLRLQQQYSRGTRTETVCWFHPILASGRHTISSIRLQRSPDMPEAVHNWHNCR